MLFALAIIVGVGAVLFMSTRAYGFVKGVPTLINVKSIGDGQTLRDDAADSYLRMQADAAEHGIELRSNSGFRTMAEQLELRAAYEAGTGNLAARPGYSNHQSGTANDFAYCQSFTTPTYLWLKNNAHRYGWRNTGANFSQPEPWHWEFYP
jgi:LAS superfamily LD-carboxypeptidase LdcB